MYHFGSVNSSVNNIAHNYVDNNGAVIHSTSNFPPYQYTIDHNVENRNIPETEPERQNHHRSMVSMPTYVQQPSSTVPHAPNEINNTNIVSSNSSTSTTALRQWRRRPTVPVVSNTASTPIERNTSQVRSNNSTVNLQSANVGNVNVVASTQSTSHYLNTPNQINQTLVPPNGSLPPANFNYNHLHLDTNNYNIKNNINNKNYPTLSPQNIKQNYNHLHSPNRGMNSTTRVADTQNYFQQRHQEAKIIPQQAVLYNNHVVDQSINNYTDLSYNKNRKYLYNNELPTHSQPNGMPTPISNDSSIYHYKVPISKEFNNPIEPMNNRNNSHMKNESFHPQKSHLLKNNFTNGPMNEAFFDRNVQMSNYIDEPGSKNNYYSRNNSIKYMDVFKNPNEDEYPITQLDKTNTKTFHHSGPIVAPQLSIPPSNLPSNTYHSQTHTNEINPNWVRYTDINIRKQKPPTKIDYGPMVSPNSYPQISPPAKDLKMQPPSNLFTHPYHSINQPIKQPYYNLEYHNYPQLSPSSSNNSNHSLQIIQQMKYNHWKYNNMNSGPVNHTVRGNPYPSSIANNTMIHDKYPFHGIHSNNVPTDNNKFNFSQPVNSSQYVGDSNIYQNQHHRYPPSAASLDYGKSGSYHHSPNNAGLYQGIPHTSLPLNSTQMPSYYYHSNRFTNDCCYEKMKPPTNTVSIDYDMQIKMNALPQNQNRGSINTAANLNLKQFLETWDEEEEDENVGIASFAPSIEVKTNQIENMVVDNEIPNLPDVVLSNTVTNKVDKIGCKGSEASEKDQMLYVLETTDISPETVLTDYKHIQQIDKLPDNIKVVNVPPNDELKLNNDTMTETDNNRPNLKKHEGALETKVEFSATYPERIDSVIKSSDSLSCTSIENLIGTVIDETATVSSACSVIMSSKNIPKNSSPVSIALNKVSSINAQANMKKIESNLCLSNSSSETNEHSNNNNKLQVPEELSDPKESKVNKKVNIGSEKSTDDLNLIAIPDKLEELPKDEKIKLSSDSNNEYILDLRNEKKREDELQSNLDNQVNDNIPIDYSTVNLENQLKAKSVSNSTELKLEKSNNQSEVENKTKLNENVTQTCPQNTVINFSNSNEHKGQEKNHCMTPCKNSSEKNEPIEHSEAVTNVEFTKNDIYYPDLKNEYKSSIEDSDEDSDDLSEMQCDDKKDFEPMIKERNNDEHHTKEKQIVSLSEENSTPVYKTERLIQYPKKEETIHVNDQKNDEKCELIQEKQNDYNLTTTKDKIQVESSTLSYDDYKPKIKTECLKIEKNDNSISTSNFQKELLMNTELKVDHKTELEFLESIKNNYLKTNKTNDSEENVYTDKKEITKTSDNKNEDTMEKINEKIQDDIQHPEITSNCENLEFDPNEKDQLSDNNSIESNQDQDLVECPEKISENLNISPKEINKNTGNIDSFSKNQSNVHSLNKYSNPNSPNVDSSLLSDKEENIEKSCFVSPDTNLSDNENDKINSCCLSKTVLHDENNEKNVERLSDNEEIYQLEHFEFQANEDIGNEEVVIDDTDNDYTNENNPNVIRLENEITGKPLFITTTVEESQNQEENDDVDKEEIILPNGSIILIIETNDPVLRDEYHLNIVNASKDLFDDNCEGRRIDEISLVISSDENVEVSDSLTKNESDSEKNNEENPIQAISLSSGQADVDTVETIDNIVNMECNSQDNENSYKNNDLKKDEFDPTIDNKKTNLNSNQENRSIFNRKRSLSLDINENVQESKRIHLDSKKQAKNIWRRGSHNETKYEQNNNQSFRSNLNLDNKVKMKNRINQLPQKASKLQQKVQSFNEILENIDSYMIKQNALSKYKIPKFKQNTKNLKKISQLDGQETAESEMSEKPIQNNLIQNINENRIKIKLKSLSKYSENLKNDSKTKPGERFKTNCNVKKSYNLHEKHETKKPKHKKSKSLIAIGGESSGRFLLKTNHSSSLKSLSVNHSEPVLDKSSSSSSPSSILPKMIIKRSFSENGQSYQASYTNHDDNVFRNIYKWQPFVKIPRSNKLDTMAKQFKPEELSSKIILKINKDHNVHTSDTVGRSNDHCIQPQQEVSTIPSLKCNIHIENVASSLTTSKNLVADVRNKSKTIITSSTEAKGNCVLSKKD